MIIRLCQFRFLLAFLATAASASTQPNIPPFKQYELQSPQSNRIDFVIGPYRVGAPASFQPWGGQPGDPRRSRFLVLTIPAEMLKLPSALQKRLPRLVVVKLSLEPDDATRLAGYAGVIDAEPSISYDGYIGHHLNSAFELYVAPPGRSPSYVICPLPLGRRYAMSPMLCNVDTTVVSGGKRSSDLTMSVVFGDDNWAELPALIDSLRSAVEQLVFAARAGE